MSAGRNREFGRVVIVLAVVLFGIFLTFDLSRRDSLVRAFFRPDPPPRNQPRELLDALRRSR